MIQLNDVEIIPRKIPEHTYLLLRCLEQKYAQAFVERGAMKFTQILDWCKSDGTSRGDILEGVYASQRGNNTMLDGMLRALRTEPIFFNNEDFTFYKSKTLLSYRAHCLYGLNSNNMHIQAFRSQDHQYHKVGKVAKEYFQRLFPHVKESEMDSLDPIEKPVVLFIRPDSFMHFVKSKLIERGVWEDEIIIHPVAYMDYYKKPFIIGNEPEELFSKHIVYSEQNEIRIVINTSRKEVQSLFDENGVIELGPVDKSIASISEFYFRDMNIEIRDDKLLNELAKPQEYPIEMVDDISLIIIIQQALSDELPNAPMSIDSIENEMGNMLKILRQRDENAMYDSVTNQLFYKGKVYDLGGKAGYKMLEHYNNYILSGDIKSAGETIAKFKHFFPKYDMGNYFSAYYKAIKEQVGAMDGTI